MKLPSLPAIEGFINPIIMYLEKREMIRRRLVGHYEVIRVWNASDFDSDIGFDRERIVFFLFEYPSGRRVYETYDYGRCEDKDAYQEHLPEVLLWVHGGPMPSGTKKPGDSPPKVEVIPMVRKRT
jgi:hypothetical protein